MMIKVFIVSGTNYENMSPIQTRFSRTSNFYLTENYRSTQTILDGCNKLIKNNENREPKELFSRNKGKEDDVIIVQTESEKDEVNYVLDAVRSLKTTTTRGLILQYYIVILLY